MSNTPSPVVSPLAALRARVPQRPVQAGLFNTLKLMWKVFFAKPRTTRPSGRIPVHTLTAAALLAAPDHTVYRLGHSTLLLKLRGGFWLTDPVFSKRASPIQWAGPKRFHAPPIAIKDLPPLRGVILSHDHYDHLDYASIQALAPKTDVFLTPRGVGDRLIAWGVPAEKVRQLNWWEETEVEGIRFVPGPAKHFSGRTLRDGNRTQWASWIIVDGDTRVFFSGDTGYSAGFRQIGERYGPFDLTLMETGAYDARWPGVHMQPEESLQAHLDLRGKWMLPIHNGTFDLAFHDWHEPYDRIVALGKQHGVQVTTPRMGEAVAIGKPHAGEAWWVGVDAVTA